MKTNLFIKIIYNPSVPRGYSFQRIIGPPREYFYLKIYIATPADLNEMVDIVADDIGKPRHIFNIIFNWKNLPRSVSENKNFRRRIMHIFGHPDDIENMAKLVRYSMETYGGTPDMHCGGAKVRNYIASVLGRPEITTEIAEKIATHIKNVK